MLKKTLVLLACGAVALTLATPVFAQSTAKIDKIGGPVPEATTPSDTTKPDTTTKTSQPATTATPPSNAPSTAAPSPNSNGSANTPQPVGGITAAEQTSTSTDGGSFVPLTQFPQIKQIATASSLPQFLNTLYKICIGAAAALALLMIMYAGVEIMRSSGSVTTNEKAKSRIQNAVLGLVLVLAPTIVFGIINPSILDLNFGKNFGLLQSAPINQAAFNASNATSTASTTAALACRTQYPGGILATNPGKSCSSLPGAVTIGTTCCAGLAPGAACCWRPPAQTVADSWMWRGPFESAGGSGRHTEEGGPFTTQQSCQASFASFVNGHPNYNISSSGLVCDCTKPRSQFPACAAN